MSQQRGQQGVAWLKVSVLERSQIRRCDIMSQLFTAWRKIKKLYLLDLFFFPRPKDTGCLGGLIYDPRTTHVRLLFRRRLVFSNSCIHQICSPYLKKKQTKKTPKGRARHVDVLHRAAPPQGHRSIALGIRRCSTCSLGSGGVHLKTDHIAPHLAWQLDCQDLNSEITSDPSC